MANGSSLSLSVFIPIYVCLLEIMIVWPCHCQHSPVYTHSYTYISTYASLYSAVTVALATASTPHTSTLSISKPKSLIRSFGFSGSSILLQAQSALGFIRIYCTRLTAYACIDNFRTRYALIVRCDGIFEMQTPHPRMDHAMAPELFDIHNNK